MVMVDIILVCFCLTFWMRVWFSRQPAEDAVPVARRCLHRRTCQPPQASGLAQAGSCGARYVCCLGYTNFGLLWENKERWGGQRNWTRHKILRFLYTFRIFMNKRMLNCNAKRGISVSEENFSIFFDLRLIVLISSLLYPEPLVLFQDCRYRHLVKYKFGL
jgi:hypothetical protein